nr:MAG TPA: hypothetical protein [Caudoviricetes sp.]
MPDNSYSGDVRHVGPETVNGFVEKAGDRDRISPTFPVAPR